MTTADISAYGFVVASNLTFLLPISYLIYQRRVHNAVHVLLTFALMFASTVYHFCDKPSSLDMGGICILPFSGLYLMDFSLSLLVAVNLLTYNIPNEIVWLREVSIAASFIGMTYLYSALHSFNNIGYYVFGLIMSLIVIGFRIRHRCIRVTRWGILTVFLFAAGFVFYILDTSWHYQVLHGCWHILAAVALLCGFYYFDRLNDVSEEREMLMADDYIF
jgi:hypothetical protein